MQRDGYRVTSIDYIVKALSSIGDIVDSQWKFRFNCFKSFCCDCESNMFSLFLSVPVRCKMNLHYEMMVTVKWTNHGLERQVIGLATYVFRFRT